MMASIFNQMSKWHPLPIDSQVADAIQDRKDLLMSHFRDKQMHVDDTWVFNHLMTVLDHAKKIFQTDAQSLIQDVEHTIKQHNQTNGSRN